MNISYKARFRKLKLRRKNLHQDSLPSIGTVKTSRMPMVPKNSMHLKTGTIPLPYIGASVAPVIQADSNMKDCDECKFKDVTKDATGFCVHCKMFLCAQCNFNHQTNEWTKQHIILHGNEIPKGRNQEIPGDFCDLHPSNTLDFYCPVHEEVFCPLCKESKHSRCINVTVVEEAAKGAKLNRDLPRTVQDVRRLIVQYEKLKTQKMRQINGLNDDLMECLNSVTSLKVQVNTVLDNLEQRVRAVIEKRVSKEIKHREETKHSCEERITKLKLESNNLDKNKMADDSKCFVSILRAKGIYSDCTAALVELMKDKKDIKFHFEANYKLMYFLKELDSLGQLKSSVVRPKSSTFRTPSVSVTAPTPSTDVPSNMMSELKNGKDFILCGEYNISSPDDTKSSSSVTSSTFLPDGRLLLCDSRNYSVKLLDHNLQLKSVYKMSHPPYDVTPLTSREAVVTCPEKKELHFIIMDPELRISRIVSTDIGCHGIRVHKDGLLATSYNHGVYGVVRLLDMNGGVKHIFDRDTEGNPYFQGPTRIAINQKRDRFYVSDKNTNTVVGLTIGGKIVFR